MLLEPHIDSINVGMDLFESYYSPDVLYQPIWRYESHITPSPHHVIVTAFATKIAVFAL